MDLHSLPADWRNIVSPEFSKPYWKQLNDFLETEEKNQKTIYPPKSEIFAALRQTNFDDVKVVIIGQDPYHGEHQAMGLSFSVHKGIRLPPSLKNIYKEIEAEFDVKMSKSGDLTSWAKQGVLLLNATLTVEAGKAGSHQKKGWEDFTDAIIHAVSDKQQHVVYMLWGSYAQKKGSFIDRKNNLVLESVHPSPLSAHRGFLGNGHFKKANEYLAKNNREEIKWWDLNI